MQGVYLWDVTEYVQDQNAKNEISGDIHDNRGLPFKMRER